MLDSAEPRAEDQPVPELHSQANLASSPTPATPFECDEPDGHAVRGADGNFYLMTYGSGFFNINPGAAIFKWSYVKGQRPPVAVIGADKTDGKLPLTVNFSSVGSKTPEPSHGKNRTGGVRDCCSKMPTGSLSPAGLAIAAARARSPRFATRVKTTFHFSVFVWVCKWPWSSLPAMFVG